MIVARCVVFLLLLSDAASWPIMSTLSTPPTFHPSNFESCIEVDIFEIEKLRTELFSTYELQINDTGNKYDTPFGLLDEDWHRLKLLEIQIPNDSVLKTRILNLFRLLITAIFQAHLRESRLKPKEQANEVRAANDSFVNSENSSVVQLKDKVRSNSDVESSSKYNATTQSNNEDEIEPGFAESGIHENYVSHPTSSQTVFSATDSENLDRVSSFPSSAFYVTDHQNIVETPALKSDTELGVDEITPTPKEYPSTDKDNSYSNYLPTTRSFNSFITVTDDSTLNPISGDHTYTTVHLVPPSSTGTSIKPDKDYPRPDNKGLPDEPFTGNQIYTTAELIPPSSINTNIEPNEDVDLPDVKDLPDKPITGDQTYTTTEFLPASSINTNSKPNEDVVLPGFKNLPDEPITGDQTYITTDIIPPSTIKSDTERDKDDVVPDSKKISDGFVTSNIFSTVESSMLYHSTTTIPETNSNSVNTQPGNTLYINKVTEDRNRSTESLEDSEFATFKSSITTINYLETNQRAKELPEKYSYTPTVTIAPDMKPPTLEIDSNTEPYPDISTQKVPDSVQTNDIFMYTSTSTSSFSTTPLPSSESLSNEKPTTKYTSSQPSFDITSQADAQPISTSFPYSITSEPKTRVDSITSTLREEQYSTNASPSTYSTNIDSSDKPLPTKRIEDNIIPDARELPDKTTIMTVISATTVSTSDEVDTSPSQKDLELDYTVDRSSQSLNRISGTNVVTPSLDEENSSNTHLNTAPTSTTYLDNNNGHTFHKSESSTPSLFDKTTLKNEVDTALFPNQKEIPDEESPAINPLPTTESNIEGSSTFLNIITNANKKSSEISGRFSTVSLVPTKFEEANPKENIDYDETTPYFGKSDPDVVTPVNIITSYYDRQETPDSDSSNGKHLPDYSTTKNFAISKQQDVNPGLTTKSTTESFKLFSIFFPKPKKSILRPTTPVKKLKIFPRNQYPYRLHQSKRKNSCGSRDNCVHVPNIEYHYPPEHPTKDKSSLSINEKSSPGINARSLVKKNLTDSSWWDSEINWLNKMKYLKKDLDNR